MQLELFCLVVQRSSMSMGVYWRYWSGESTQVAIIANPIWVGILAEVYGDKIVRGWYRISPEICEVE
jgi:hypothetical protein